MKKLITVDDLTQLTKNEREHLFNLWQPYEGQEYITLIDGIPYVGRKHNILTKSRLKTIKEFGISKNSIILPLLTIGDIIEMLNWKNTSNISTEQENLCNSIWEALKQFLGKDDYK